MKKCHLIVFILIGMLKMNQQKDIRLIINHKKTHYRPEYRIVYTKSVEILILTANCNQNVDRIMSHLFCVFVIKDKRQ